MASRRTALVCLAAGLAACSRAPQPESPPTAEAKAYVKNLELSEVNMKATESLAKQVVTEIEGKVTNNGNRTVEFAEVACVFRDSAGQVILRERVPIIRTTLKPGQTRSFRLPFDDVPATWNNQMPSLVVAQIKLS